jgi:hypothetical protein
MLEILKGQPNMKVSTIIRTVKEIYDGYQITYGKAGLEDESGGMENDLWGLGDRV